MLFGAMVWMRHSKAAKGEMQHGAEDSILEFGEGLRELLGDEHPEATMESREDIHRRMSAPDAGTMFFKQMCHGAQHVLRKGDAHRVRYLSPELESHCQHGGRGGPEFG